MRRRGFLARELAVIGTLLVVTIVYTWPLAKFLKRAVPDPGDPLLNAWILDWTAHAAHTTGSIFHPPVFHPSRYALAFSENLLGLLPLTLPLHLAGAGPITIYNIAQILGFVLSGYGAYLLARHVVARTLPAFAAGLFFAFVPFRFDHLSHVQHLWSVWLPLLLAALLALHRLPSWPRVALLAVAFAFNALTNVHWFVFGSFSILCTIVLLLPSSRDPRRFLTMAAAAVVAGALITMPALLPYREASDLYGMKRNEAEVALGSAVIGDWLVPTPRSEIYGRMQLARAGEHERRLFPGLVAPFFLLVTFLFASSDSGRGDPPTPGKSVARWRIHLLDALAAVSLFIAVLAHLDSGVHWRPGGVQILSTDSFETPMFLAISIAIVRCSLQFPAGIRHRRRNLADLLRRSRLDPGTQAGILWIVIGFAGSLGLNGILHSFLFDTFDIFESIRTPARWSMITYTGLAITIATGLKALSDRARVQNVMSIVVVTLLLVELQPRRIRWFLEDPQTPMVYRWLKSIPEQIVAEIPLSNDGGVEVQYMFRHSGHYRPIVNGISGFESPSHAELAHHASQRPISPELTTALERFGVSAVIVHAHSLNNDDAVLHWLREALRTDRIRYLRRFDHHDSGDFVFAVTKNAKPELLFHAAIGIPGLHPDQQLERLINREIVPPDDVALRIETPVSDSATRGPLRVSGWVATREPVAQIAIHLENRRWQAIANRSSHPRQGIDDGPIAIHLQRFELTLEQRPDDVSRETDVQVEIKFGSGRSIWSRSVWIDWTPRRRTPLRRWNGSALEGLAIRLGLSPAETQQVAADPNLVAEIAYGHLMCDCDDKAFIMQLHERLLGRPVDDENLRTKRRRLREGTDRRDLIDEVATSEEFAKIHGE